jgi:hypothetical protein
MPWEHKYPDDELLAAAVRLGAQRDGKLTLYEFCDAVGVSPSTIHLRFGGWLKFRAKAGLSAKRTLPEVSHEEVRQELIELANKAGLKFGWEVNVAEFCGFARVSTNTIIKLFGNWRKLMKLAKLPTRCPPARTHWKIMMLEVQRLERQLGRMPTWEDIEQFGRYGTARYRKRFGSYANVMRASQEHLKGQRALRESGTSQAAPPPK